MVKVKANSSRKKIKPLESKPLVEVTRASEDTGEDVYLVLRDGYLIRERFHLKLGVGDAVFKRMYVV